MTYSLRLITPPDDDVVTLNEAKGHLRVDDSDNDTLISALISAATEAVDGASGFLGRALALQTWDYFQDCFPSYNGSSAITPLGTGASIYPNWQTYIPLPLPPLVSVTGVYYRDNSGVEQTVDPTKYTVITNSEPGKVYLPSGGAWPSVTYGPSAVRIRFVAGYADTDDIPKSIKAAILIYIADLFKNRQSMSDTLVNKVPWSAEQLLRKYRFDLGMA